MKSLTPQEALKMLETMNQVEYLHSISSQTIFQITRDMILAKFVIESFYEHVIAQFLWKHNYDDINNPPAFINMETQENGLLINNCLPTLEVKEFLESILGVQVKIDPNNKFSTDNLVIQMGTSSQMLTTVRLVMQTRIDEEDDPIEGWMVHLNLGFIPSFFDVATIIKNIRKYQDYKELENGGIVCYPLELDTSHLSDWTQIIDSSAFKIVVFDKAGLSDDDLM